MKTVAIIPARGGSKGVLRKNIRHVAGNPLIAYTIAAAKGAARIDRLLVSTEDDEIAAVAESLGVEVLKRPSEYAEDTSPMLDVVKHVFKTVGDDYDAAVLLQPSAPMRTADDIDGALTILADGGCDSVVSVYQVTDHHPARMYRLVENRLQPLQAEPPNRLRQSLPAVYHRNGAIYAFKRSTVEKFESLTGETIFPWLMPKERSVNIDDELDLKIADILLAGYRP